MARTTTPLATFLATEPVSATTGDTQLLALAGGSGKAAHQLRGRYRVARLVPSIAGVTHVYWPAAQGGFNDVCDALLPLVGVGGTFSQFRAKGTWALLDAKALLATHRGQVAVAAGPGLAFPAGLADLAAKLYRTGGLWLAPFQPLDGTTAAPAAPTAKVWTTRDGQVFGSRAERRAYRKARKAAVAAGPGTPVVMPAVGAKLAPEAAERLAADHAKARRAATARSRRDAAGKRQGTEAA